MATFGTPFSGLAKDRKLTDAELAPDEEKFYDKGAGEVENVIKKIK